MAIDYVSADSTTLRAEAASSGKMLRHLLWGDRVKVLSSSGAWCKVQARGADGFVRRDDLGGSSLLEVYFIDVGQGDGILVRTPDHRHVMIDGGHTRSRQRTRRNAADFVDWKFVHDYRESAIALDAVIASHNDADHFGGLWDLLSDDPRARQELEADGVSVESFYHAGVSWWTEPGGKRSLGRIETMGGERFLVDLLGDRADALDALSRASWSLNGEWAKFITAATQAKTKAGQPTPIRRLSHLDEYLPGFAPGAADAVAIRVLAPVEFEVGARRGVRRYPQSDSKSTNGNSVLLRLDYRGARILLTGDLNTDSQRALLKDYAGSRQEFACDVAKACHHGSDDVSFEFLQTLQPSVTVISSGDDESHDHPRPSIVGASAVTGFLKVDRDRLVSPLIYSTEIARSLKLTQLSKGRIVDGADVLTGAALKRAKVEFGRSSRVADDTFVVTGIVYGLINVRTDGRRILCAALNEANHTWSIKEVQSRF